MVSVSFDLLAYTLKAVDNWAVTKIYTFNKNHKLD